MSLAGISFLLIWSAGVALSIWVETHQKPGRSKNSTR